MTKIYAGIGSRETPAEVLAEMELIACNLAQEGWVLRSGGADGADEAFEFGADTAAEHISLESYKEIYLPWPNFNGNSSQFTNVGPKALALASQFHPAWDRLSQGAQKLHARNGYQILGGTLDVPANVVICYTEGGKLKGGTAQAIRLAMANNIPVLNYGEWMHSFTPSEITQHFLNWVRSNT